MALIYKSINPINSEEASLHHVSADEDSPDVMNRLVSYSSRTSHATDDEVCVDYACKDGITYRIVEIEGGAFSNCKELKRIYISRYVRRITWNMFQCTSLLNIDVDEDNEHFKSIDGVLFTKSKDRMKLVGFPAGRTGSYKVPDGTVELGNCSFKSSKISELILPDSLQVIGINALYECDNLKEIVVPDTIKIVKSNDNRLLEPITQKFYLRSDIQKATPYTICELRNKFPEK